MKILLEINDSKAEFFLELLKNFSFVKKATLINESKAALMKEVKESMNELKLVREGKIKGVAAGDLLNEL